MKPARGSAFTLVELLTVMGVIAILLAILLPPFLAEFAAALIGTPYDGDDDKRQAQNRLVQGLSPIQQAE